MSSNSIGIVESGAQHHAAVWNNFFCGLSIKTIYHLECKES